MSPTEADDRLELSRYTLTKLAEAHVAGALAAPPLQYVDMVGAEIVVLRGIAAEHPAKADTVAYLVERCEELAAALRTRVN